MRVSILLCAVLLVLYFVPSEAGDFTSTYIHFAQYCSKPSTCSLDVDGLKTSIKAAGGTSAKAGTHLAKASTILDKVAAPAAPVLFLAASLYNLHLIVLERKNYTTHKATNDIQSNIAAIDKSIAIVSDKLNKFELVMWGPQKQVMEEIWDDIILEMDSMSTTFKIVKVQVDNAKDTLKDDHSRITRFLASSTFITVCSVTGYALNIGATALGPVAPIIWGASALVGGISFGLSTSDYVDNRELAKTLDQIEKDVAEQSAHVKDFTTQVRYIKMHQTWMLAQQCLSLFAIGVAIYKIGVWQGRRRMAQPLLAEERIS